jgi:hypothetical protein
MKQVRGSRAVPILAALTGIWSAPHCVTTSGFDRARGQSGSEVVSNGGTGGTSGGDGNEQPPGGNTVPCPCGFPVTNESAIFASEYRVTATLRVTLLERTLQAFDSPEFPWCSSSGGPEPGCARVRLRVDEVLVSNVAVEAGDEIEAGTDGRLPCVVGTDRVGIGNEALAQVSWPRADLPFCEARAACLEQCESEYESDLAECERSGRAPGECLPHPLSGYCDVCDSGFDTCPPRPPLSDEQIATLGGVRLTLWEDQILFAATDQAELRVPASELSELQDADEQCIQRYGDWASLPGAFPDGPAP